MSLHYLLDGYNITHQMPLMVLKTLEDQRQQLIRWIESSQPQGSTRNVVTIVFDGRSDVSWGSQSLSSVRVVFAQGESADQKIIRIVEESEYKKNIVVITDDRGLKYAVRALGAQVGSVQGFMNHAKNSFVKSPQMGKHISKMLEYKITSEFEKIWLKNKKAV